MSHDSIYAAIWFRMYRSRWNRQGKADFAFLFTGLANYLQWVSGQTAGKRAGGLGKGIGVCCTCFLIAFYCRSVKLDDKIFESIKETAPIVEIDDLILQRVGSAYYYNPQPSVERRHTLASSNQKASWWQMRHGDADEISIYSGGGGTRPGSAASSIIGQGAHAFHPHIIIPRGFHHAEYIPASEVCSSIHSSPLHGSSPGPQTPLSFMSIDIPEEPEPDLERPSTSRVPIG
ncbi:hypothetical protein BIW11_12198 [Tropilaelaps mercedesae]|uniref:Uncharacterized protein n=1 Tax=Tropilaelaps mercedesae TaxID=418985 RepID=A0A1V9X7H5_9ACAR|nr:hypothetical protein BIW11_12198 [Tropilaelaps mercedesae]